MVLFFNAGPLKAQTDSTANLPQFLFPEFTASVVKLKTGTSFSAKMNYNTLSEKMTFYQNGVLLDLNKPESVDTIIIQNRQFIYNENAFFEVLLNAPISLFIQHKSGLESLGREGAYGTKSQTVGPVSVSKLYSNGNTYNLKIPEDFKIIPSTVNWIRLDSVMHKFLTERQFLKLFPSKKEQLKQFINQSELNINKPDDLIKLVTYCNQLFK